MGKHFSFRTRAIKRLLVVGVVGAVLILLVDAATIRSYEHRLAEHAAAPTFTVCHATPKSQKASSSEKYYCSNEGCYSDETYTMSVIGSYQDGNTCAGIAKHLQEGIR